jgi:hypothetical protein
MGQLARQLDAAPVHEQVDDRAIEELAPGRGQGLTVGAADMDAAPLTAQHAGDGAAAARIAVDEEQRG